MSKDLQNAIFSSSVISGFGTKGTPYKVLTVFIESHLGHLHFLAISLTSYCVSFPQPLSTYQGSLSSGLSIHPNAQDMSECFSIFCFSACLPDSIVAKSIGDMFFRINETVQTENYYLSMLIAYRHNPMVYSLSSTLQALLMVQEVTVQCTHCPSW